jgi:LmbE family N-acetylglucosaminyl deacetylase
LIDGLGVNTRVLMIGAHPDDEDTFLITWLQRGRHVETAYLSLTRGDGGQNLIGNELGEALGVIRTEELLAARRIDGARQYFTRAFDFGFSKDTIDTYKHWTRDSILNDVVRVVRMFRPHVIVAVFSGTPRDGHGHHQVSGLVARAAYEIAGDTIRFPTATYGAAWTPLKFYRVARPASEATLTLDVGEYSPLLGRSFAEVASESRSQHKSQGFGALQRKGPVLDYLRREASRVNAGQATERSIFDGVDTTWARFRATALNASARAAIDSLPAAFLGARAKFDAFKPDRVVPALSVVQRLLIAVKSHDPDFGASYELAMRRVWRAFALARGAASENTASHEVGVVGRAMPLVSTFYNRGSETLTVSGPQGLARPGLQTVPPGGLHRDSVRITLREIAQPWWLTQPRAGAMFASGTLNPLGETASAAKPDPFGESNFAVDSGTYEFSGKRPGFGVVFDPPAFRFADQVKGEVLRAVVGAPAISVTIDQSTQFAVANTEIDREVNVRLRSADDSVRDTRVSLVLPRGLAADSGTRARRLMGYDHQLTVTFRIRGRLAVGEYRIDAIAESNGEAFASGYELIDYDHIQRRRLYSPASIDLSVVDVQVPAALRVAYVAGVGDNVAATLAQLGIPVTMLSAGDVSRADLSSFSTVVVGPRAYEAHPELLAANPKLFDFARKGGVLMVQYGQYEMTQPGAMPFPITLARPADRVTLEDAPVTIDAPGARELTFPNKITASDFDGWVQERGLYMPRTFDPAYRSFFSMNDPNEAPLRSGLLVAPLGDGLYVYATLSFFRQLPAGVPGGARLFINLLSAKLAPPGATP